MDWDSFRRNSRGWEKDPIARLHPRITFGNKNIPMAPSVTHVVNCASDDMSPHWFKKQHPERYACINAIDSSDVNITLWYPEFEKVMNNFMNEPECRMIYVHCECGINRSAFLCLIYVCRKFGLTINSALRSILMQRPCAFTNQSFRKQVVDYI